MTFTEWFMEEEKKRKEQKQLNETKDKDEQLKEIEKISHLSKIKLDLEKLKELIINWVIEPNFVKDLLKWEAVDDLEIEKIFEKIDEIENIKNIDKLLPPNLRLSKEEYISAINNLNQRIAILSKIDQALIYLYQQNSSHNIWWFDMFAGIMYLLNKNLQIVQWNYIDIKTNLESKNK